MLFVCPTGKANSKEKSNAIAISFGILSTCRRLPHAGGALMRSHLRGDALLQSALCKVKLSPAGQRSVTLVEAYRLLPVRSECNLSTPIALKKVRSAICCALRTTLHSNRTSAHLKCGESAVSALSGEVNVF